MDGWMWSKRLPFQFGPAAARQPALPSPPLGAPRGRPRHIAAPALPPPALLPLPPGGHQRGGAARPPRRRARRRADAAHPHRPSMSLSWSVGRRRRLLSAGGARRWGAPWHRPGCAPAPSFTFPVASKMVGSSCYDLAHMRPCCVAASTTAACFSCSPPPRLISPHPTPPTLPLPRYAHMCQTLALSCTFQHPSLPVNLATVS